MKRYIRTKDGRIFDTSCYKGGWYIGKDLKQSDNIFDLIEVGDLVEFMYKGTRAGIIEIALYNLDSSNKENVIKIYTKQGNDYILVWDKDKGVI